MRVTRKAIIAKVFTTTGVKPEYVGLEKYEGEYYWSEKAGACFIGSCTYSSTLVSIETCVADFESKLEEWHDARLSSQEGLSVQEKGLELNKYIESLDWSVD